MNVLVCGSRVIEDRSVVYDALDNAPWEPETIVHGDARGVDSIADRYARSRNIDRDVHPIPEWVWEEVGATAGPMRNGYMVEQSDAVVAIWDGESTGTKDTLKQAETAGCPIYKVVCSKQDGEWCADRAQLIEDDQMGLDDFC